MAPLPTKVLVVLILVILIITSTYYLERTHHSYTTMIFGPFFSRGDRKSSNPNRQAFTTTKGRAASRLSHSPYRDALPPLSGEQFEEQGNILPEVVCESSAGEGGGISMSSSLCPNCHLNRSCFDPSSSVWYPTRCSSVRLTRKVAEASRSAGGGRLRPASAHQAFVAASLVTRCLTENRTILWLGDSRIRHLFQKLVAMADRNDKLLIRGNVGKTGQSVVQLVDENAETEIPSDFVSLLARPPTDWATKTQYILEQKQYQVGRLWHLTETDPEKLNPILDNLGRQKGPKHLILFGNAPWILLLERDGQPQVNLRNKVAASHENLRKLLANIEKRKSADTEVIFILDIQPVTMLEGNTTWGPFLDASLNIGEGDLALIQKEFPFVKVMDSHLQAARTYTQICQRGDFNEKTEDEVPVEDWHTCNQTCYWNCDDRWHPGDLLYGLIVQLLLNHVCSF